jgi:Uma2 family endonuclease
MPSRHSFFHQLVARKVANALDVGCPADVLPVCYQSVKVDDRNEPRPDVALVEARNVFCSPVPVGDVLLAVEVVSEESARRDSVEKARLYARAEIPSYWIVDPRGERIIFTQFLLGEEGLYEAQLHSDRLVTVDVPWEVTLDLPGWTRHRDMILQAAGDRP